MLNIAFDMRSILNIFKGVKIVKKNVLPLLMLASVILSLIGSPVVSGQSQDLTPRAVEFMGLVSGGDYKTAIGMFDERMKAAVSEQKLKDIWQSLQTQFGAYSGQGQVRKNRIQDHDVVFVTCRFEKGVLDSQIAFDSNGMISGLYFIPTINK